MNKDSYRIFIWLALFANASALIILGIAAINPEFYIPKHIAGIIRYIGYIGMIFLVSDIVLTIREEKRNE